MKTIERNYVITVALSSLLWTVQPASAFYAPEMQRWVNRDPIEEDGGANLYRFVSNDPTYGYDAFGLMASGFWTFRCRRVELGPITSPYKHCWVECDGSSYSLLNDGGIANKKINDPRDLGQGSIVASGVGGDCACIRAQFLSNSQSYKYLPHECNSNYFANRRLACCIAGVAPPADALGWDTCSNSSNQFVCSCGR